MEIPSDCLEAVGYEADRLARKSGWRVERDDLFQEGSLGIVERINEGLEINQALARVIARRRMVNYIRWTRKLDRQTPGEEVETWDREPSDPDAVLDVRERLGRLSAKDREVLAESLNGPPKEIAERLGIGVSAAKQRLTDARRRLRGGLGGYEHMTRKHPIKYSKWARFGISWAESASRREARETEIEAA